MGTDGPGFDSRHLHIEGLASFAGPVNAIAGQTLGGLPGSFYAAGLRRCLGLAGVGSEMGGRWVASISAACCAVRSMWP